MGHRTFDKVLSFGDKLPYKNIYCDGGGEIVYELLKNKLLDQIIVSVIPHLPGNGKRLFKDGRPEQELCFRRNISYPSGHIQLWYSVIHDQKNE